jgi:hypothetical protein
VRKLCRVIQTLNQYNLASVKKSQAPVPKLPKTN